MSVLCEDETQRRYNAQKLTKLKKKTFLQPHI